MTEPKAPSFNGVPIRVGDEVAVRMLVRKVEADALGVTDLSNNNPNTTFFPLDAIASHSPARLPLKPGPALLDRVGATPVDIIALDGILAWIRTAAGGDGIVEASRLQNVEAG